MPEEPIDPVFLPSRKTIYSTYRGPKRGLGGATRLLYSWVGTYYAARAADVTVCFADRAALEAGPDAVIELEVRFDVDDWFSDSTKLPDGLQLKRVPPEAVLLHDYAGTLTGLKHDIGPWLERMARARRLEPGYRQRVVHMAKSPDSPDWEVEVAVVVA